MAQVYQVPQHSFWLLMSATLMATVPHMLRTPLWLTVAVLALLFWRVQVHKGRVRMPGKLVRGVLLFLGMGATVYSYGTLFGPEAGVTLLVFAFALKTLEMFRQRDAFVVIVLAYFVLATAFLFERGMVASIYIFLVMAVVTGALVGINQEDHQARSRQHMRISVAMVLQAVPLMLVLFVLVPRFGPLWALDIGKGQARTGMGDSMAPGEISNLSMSDELAFRVEFEGAVPPPAERYWRGLTLSEFDGRRWEQALPADRTDLLYFYGKDMPYWVQDLNQSRSGLSPDYRYQVIMEPTRRNWLFALATPFTQNSKVALARDYRLLVLDELENRLAYRVESYTGIPRDTVLPEWLKQRNLYLPRGANPQAEQLARRWFEDAGSNPEQYAQRVLNWFSQEAFFYTLQPPSLGESPVDEFLFDTRRGFCEHYASAFTVMMRAAGVPARVVLGYQGGEVNPIGSHMMVYQYDAHAWSEIWIDDRGWVRVDPTAAVAPERIEYGLEDALREEGSFLGNDPLSLSRYRDNPLLSRLRHSMDYMQLAWQKWVLGYNADAQNRFLENLLGHVTPMRIGIALALSAGLFMLVLALWMLLRRTGPSALAPWHREYWKMQKLLARKGFQLPGQPGVRTLVQCVAEQGGDTVALKRWATHYEALCYAEKGDRADIRLLKQLRREVASSLRQKTRASTV